MDAKPGLDPHQDHLDRLQEFGYNEQEAHFLYLAAIHSGYFTRHQFLSFTHQTKGCVVHRFTTKLLTQHHAQATQYGHKTYVFKLTSRKIYDLIGKQDLRDHRFHTADFIRKRLLVLDSSPWPTPIFNTSNPNRKNSRFSTNNWAYQPDFF